MRYLKQSTSVDVGIGPFLDETDGKTAETALTITQPDIRLKKNGGAWAQKAAAQTLSHEEAGWYELTLDGTDTDTIGHLLVAIHESGALPVWQEYHVLAANVYDSLFGAATDKLDVNVEEWNTTSVPAEHTAGYPIVTVKDGTGTGEINTTSGRVDADVTHWNTSTTPVTNLNTVFNTDFAANYNTTLDRWIVDATTFAGDTRATFQSAIATAVWQDATAGDFTVASSIGKSLYTSGVVPGGSGGLLISGSNSGTTTLGALTVTGATSLSTLATSGTTTLNALTVTNATTLSGAVSFGSTWTIAGSVTWSGTDWIIEGTTDMREGLSLKRTGNRAALNIYGSTTSTGRGAVYIFSQTAGQPLIEVESTTNGNLFLATGLGSGKFWPDSTITSNVIATDAIGSDELATAAATKILTTAMTEAYNTDGSTMTVAQGLYGIFQRLTEFAISGTTITVKKLDGSTTAMTLTLDSSTTPTSSTRAT